MFKQRIRGEPTHDPTCGRIGQRRRKKKKGTRVRSVRTNIIARHTQEIGERNFHGGACGHQITYIADMPFVAPRANFSKSALSVNLSVCI